MMDVFSVSFAAALGAVFGSFANVIAIRMHDMSSLWGRSHCPNCNKVVRPRHLIPIVSWLWLRGRCADCHTKIHIQYPIVEAFAALFAIAAALRHSPFGPEMLYFYAEFFLAIALLIMVTMDARWKELPLEFMIAVSLIALLARFIIAASGTSMTFLVESGFAMALPVLFFGAQWLFSRGKWLGSGDIWFGTMIGAVLGTWQQSAIAIYLAYVIGGIAVGLLFATGQVKRGMRVPFAPALALGLLLAIWFGPVIEAYVRSAFIF